MSCVPMSAEAMKRLQKFLIKKNAVLGLAKKFAEQNQNQQPIKLEQPQTTEKMNRLVINKIDKSVERQRVPRKMRAPVTLLVGTDFSGMDTPIVALNRMQPPVKFAYKFASDSDPAAAKLIDKQMPKPEKFTKDISSRSADESEYTDVYIWAAPCQPFSTGGKLKGTADPRGRLICKPLQYIKQHRPRLTIMENVGALCTRKKFKPVWKGTIKALRDCGYMVYKKVLNSKDFGVPQDRSRIYVVAILNDSLHTAFKWPVRPCDVVKIDSILESLPSDKAGRLPHRSHVRANSLAKSGCYKAMKEKVDPLKVPVLVDIDCSLKFACIGINIARTLTRGRGGSGGPWISTKGRRTTINELMQIQGFQPDSIKWKNAKVTERQMGQMLGNAMTLPVIGHILAKALNASGLVAKPVEFC